MRSLSNSHTQGMAVACLLILLANQFTIASTPAPRLEIFAEANNTPFSFSNDGKPTGYFADIVQEIMRRLNTDAAIEVVPWARAYSYGQQKPYCMFYPAMRIPEREQLFKWVGPLTVVQVSFYAKKESGVIIGSLDDAKGIVRIGVVNKFFSEQILTAAGFTNLDAANTLEQAVKKLLADRTPVLVAHDFQIQAALDAEKAPEGAVVPVFTFMRAGHYLAFSLSTPDETVQQWQAALDDMKKDGTFGIIFKKWLPDKEMP